MRLTQTKTLPARQCRYDNWHIATIRATPEPSDVDVDVDVVDM